MAKITSLTPEQEALMPVVRDEWLAIGHCTEPADRPMAEEGLVMAYKAADLAPPPHILWFDSPLAGLIGASLAEDFLNKLPKKPDMKREIDAFGERVARLAQRFINRDQAEPPTPAEKVDLEVVKKNISAQWSAVIYGQHEAFWLALYDFFGRIGLSDEVAPLAGLSQLARAAGWAWVYEEMAIITERPTELHRDDEGRLHNPDGPALSYRDGWSIWAVHGVRVTRQIIMEPLTLTPAQITGESNAEVRRVMLERYGIDRYIQGCDAKVLHEDVDDLGAPRRLLRAELPGDEALVLVEVTNSSPEPDGSYRKYWLRVDPQLRPLHPDGSKGNPQKMTCQNAVASTFGLVGEEYVLEAQS